MAAKKTQSHSKAQSAASDSLASALRLRGKVAVVTGGSRGIGFAIARALANEGCNLVITARNSAVLDKSAAQLRKEAGKDVKVISFVCDVRKPEEVDAVFASVGKHFGKIDILVNNAGISQAATPLEHTTLEIWRYNIDTNLTGVFLCTRAALPLMKRGSVIINNLSAAAKHVFPQYYAYTAAKMGALGFTLSLRKELSPRGIRVMALLPGATDTEMWQQIMPDPPREHMIDAEIIARAVLYAVLLPPNVNPSEISLDPIGGAV